MVTETKVSGGKGFKFAETMLHETTQMRITVTIKYVPHPNGSGLHHAELTLKKEKKKPSEQWDQAKETKINITNDDPHNGLSKLIQTIMGIDDLYHATKGKVALVEGEEAELIRGLEGNDNLKLLLELSKWFHTESGQSFLSSIDADELDALIASVKHTKHKKALLHLEQLVSDSVSEQSFQSWIEQNTWVFGTEYIQRHDTRKIGIHSEADFIVKSLDGYTDLIELKGADVKLFVEDKSHGCYHPSSPLSQVVGQAIHYIKVMEDHKNILADNDDLSVLKPRVKIVIGRSNTMSKREKEALRLLNATLHGIEIITYDEIISRANKLVMIYEGREEQLKDLPEKVELKVEDLPF